jgi:hypothetical protein
MFGQSEHALSGLTLKITIKQIFQQVIQVISVSFVRLRWRSQPNLILKEGLF